MFVCCIECFPIGIWMLLVYKFSYSFYLFHSFSAFVVVPNSQLTITVRESYFMCSRCWYIYQKYIYTFESNIPASTLINQFYNVRLDATKRERDRKRKERMNEKIKLWIQMKYVLYFYCIEWVNEWASGEWVCISLYLLTYL